MKQNDTGKFLMEKNIHIDSRGMVLIDDEAILDEINGGLGMYHVPWDNTINGACYNSGC